MPTRLREGEGNRIAGENPSRNLDWEASFFRAPSPSKKGDAGFSSDDSTPDEPASTDLEWLSVEECELLRRNTTGRLPDGAGTTARVFFPPLAAADFFSGLELGPSGDGGCTTTCEFS